MTKFTPVSDLLNDMPADLQSDVRTLLQTGENVLAALAVDLNTKLCFINGWVLVTNQRLMSRLSHEEPWQSWPFRAGLVLQHHDHAGVAHLELNDAKGRLATWPPRNYLLTEETACKQADTCSVWVTARPVIGRRGKS